MVAFQMNGFRHKHVLNHYIFPLNLVPVTTCVLTCLRPYKHSLNIRKTRICCTDPNDTQNQQQQLNLSVLRFTLGIPGLDESNLPRWIGYAFGSLLLLNHFVGSDSNYITPSQLRTEALGISLAAFSVFVPFLGKFLKVGFVSRMFLVVDALCVFM
ncbi:hypothetical protein POM88_011595 [Heracleum sosnowskyi]|uniref:Uncharacterized protein n=1 Tax=Heracleum sosnowskyi TaxID=360622 RepID=A0AAD8N0Z3_9APIA|nr:hypothetical protein POM88_011595 [Heracleum sosnowskyi]